MSEVRRIWARKPVRDDRSGVREGGLSEPLEFLVVDGRAVELNWLRGVLGICMHEEELQELDQVELDSLTEQIGYSPGRR